METSVRKLFKRYEKVAQAALRGDVDMDEAATLYASEFIAASPAGVMTGKNDEQLKQVMAQGYAHYRAIGTKEMSIRGLRISPMDDHHCVAHVAWRAIYARKDQPDVTIEFDVHYLVQQLGAEPRVFGWVSGDEQALLKEARHHLTLVPPRLSNGGLRKDLQLVGLDREFPLTRRPTRRQRDNEA